MRPAIFLDRDGVLNHLVLRDGVLVSPRSAADFRLIDSALDAVEALSSAGFVCIVVTNQPDIGHGLMKVEDLEGMHARLKASAPIDAIYVCSHRARDPCECRKPKPGMIHEAQRIHGIDLSQSWVVGDRWVDIAAANAAGVKSILVQHEFSMQPTSSGSPPGGLEIDATVDDLATAASLIFDVAGR